MELNDIGLPAVAEPEHVGSIPWGDSELRVTIHDSDYGPKIDVREFVLPPSPEAQRYHAPSGKGRGRTPKEPFTGYTRKGFRLSVEGIGTLVSLLVEAMARVEDDAIQHETHETATV